MNAFKNLIGQSAEIQAVIRSAQIVAATDVTVLIEGDTGTGKELMAKAIHMCSNRVDKKFITLNCAALPEALAESELFGHKKGAFTGAVEDRIGLFESANEGTIFLDEIGDISPAFQLKLLRVLQEKEIRPLGSNKRRPVDVRIVAATNKDLEEEVREGRFRQDLYYRLATFTIKLPPLRDRLEDIPYLTTFLLDEIMKELGKRVDGITTETMDCLQKYQWPGNVRELQNELKRMLVLVQTDKLEANLISPHILRATPDELRTDMSLVTGSTNGTLKDRIEQLESRVLKETLVRLSWNKTRAAEELGLSRVGLRSKLERYGIEQADQDVVQLPTKKKAKKAS